MLHVRTLGKRSEFLEVAAARQRWVMPGLILQARVRREGDSPSSGVGLALPGSQGGVGSFLLRHENGLAGPGSPGPCTSPVVGLGFTVTKKVGNAVERNRVKRRLRALAAELFPLYGRAGCNYVLIGRRMTLYRSFGALRADMETALKRVKVKT